MEINLFNFEKRVFSQFYQDGILEKIFELIGVTNKYFVEFGSNGTDTGLGNSAYLRKALGFDGLLMDGTENPEAIYDLKNEFISAENINELLEKYKVPKVFDFLSIDIDGEDFWVAGSVDLEKFKPRVVSIEFNPDIPPPRAIIQIHQQDWVWSGDDRYGCSITAAKDLLNHMGYTLVAASGVDAIFIADEEIEKNNLQFKYANDEHKIFSKATQHLSSPADLTPHTIIAEADNQDEARELIRGFLKAFECDEQESTTKEILKYNWYVEAIDGKLEHSYFLDQTINRDSNKKIEPKEGGIFLE